MQTKVQGLGSNNPKKKRKFVSLGKKINNAPFSDDDLCDTEIYIGKINPEFFKKK